MVMPGRCSGVLKAWCLPGSRSIRQCAHPGLALRTVHEMARVKVLSLSHTLATLRENASAASAAPLSPDVAIRSSPEKVTKVTLHRF